MKETKRQRVTKACDHCVKRRRKCLRVGDEPCELCVSSGRPEACTYTKPVKRRGPLAGYSTLARQSSEQLEMLRLLLGDMFLLSPQVEELAEFCMQRRTTATLATGASISRTEEERKSAFLRSGVHAWLEARSASAEPAPKIEDEMDDLDDDDALPNQGSTLASTSALASDSPVPSRTDQYSHQAPNPSAFLIPQQQRMSLHNPLQPFNSIHTPQQLPPAPTSAPPLISTRLHRGPSSSISYFAESSNPFPSIGTPLTALPAPPPQNELPAPSVISYLIEDYFSTIAHHSLPIVERQLLRDWAKEQQGQATPRSSSAPSPHPASSIVVGHELVFAMLAVAARYTTLVVGAERGSSAWVDSFKVQAGQALAGAIRAPTLHTVQAALLLAHVDLGRDDFSSASAHFGIALALAYALGLHQSSSSFYDRDQAGRAEYGVRTFGGLIVCDTLLESDEWPSTRLNPLRSERNESASANSAGPSPSSSAGANPLSTFRELIKLSLAAMPLLYALNYPMDGPPRPVEHLFASFVSWEEGLPAHLQLAADQQRPPHKFELRMICNTFKLLATRPRSIGQPLSALCITQTLRTLALLESHINLDPRHLSTPTTSPVITTLASALLSPAAEVGTHSHWETLAKAARHYSRIFPSARNLLATLLGLPQTSTIPGLASLREELARAQEIERAVATTTEAPPLETGAAQQAASDTLIMADFGAGLGRLDAAQLPAPASGEWPSVGTAELELLAHLGGGSVETSSFGHAGGGGSDPMPLLGSGMHDFAADFADWSPAIPQSTDQFLRSLGVRGPTRPPSPSAPALDSSALNELDLVGRWQGVPEEQWTWPEALDLP
ncbi:hypothetical protein BCR35DRAFT_309904 [Leucosporidium creatinivorum]|uniref:Zn(2)-C6 fungal-type domain-containing protein n=1 Tax=Leucosporidium creatinivorum TaxID=106004 RepID=A0A1Y2DAA4_9BASI|nr:hypothetical protein BCR35DRAFT_309904 [Leucosporidium creatinivorum]